MIDRFPGAPAGSYVSDEGWLIVGDQAWTVEEWRQTSLGGRRPPGRPRASEGSPAVIAKRLNERRRYHARRTA